MRSTAKKIRKKGWTAHAEYSTFIIFQKKIRNQIFYTNFDFDDSTGAKGNVVARIPGENILKMVNYDPEYIIRYAKELRKLRVWSWRITK